MRCRQTPTFLLYMPFISSVFCSAALLLYTYFSVQLQSCINHGQSLPHIGCIPNNHHPQVLSSLEVSTGHIDSSKNCSLIASHEKQKDISNINSLPLIDFKDLGNKKQKVLLLIIVSTAPQRFDRRQAIRDTWWKHCTGDKSLKQVQCVFITDGFIVDHVQRSLTVHEKYLYNDIELQPLLGGREFGLRFLNHIKWAMAKFNFRYLLRIDDDYFLCLKRLLSELPLRPKKSLVWGYFHCHRVRRTTWMDEAFMIFTPDIIQTFLAQNESTMLCHPHADQQIALWLNNITRKLFFHDARLYHDPPASFSPKFNNITNVCDSYLGIHGTYVQKMRYFGRNANDSAKHVRPMLKFSRFCPTTTFDHRVMKPRFVFEPKPCKDNPTWKVERKMFVGRESH